MNKSKEVINHMNEALEGMEAAGKAISQAAATLRSSTKDFNKALGEYRDKCVAEDDAVPDIAKERYRTIVGVSTDIYLQSDDPDTILLAAQINATDAQMKLMAAAPELADMMREEVNIFSCLPLDQAFRLPLIKRIKLLRKLGITGVAPWYKDE